MSQAPSPSRRQLLSGQIAPSDESHICSLVVHGRHERLEGVMAALRAMPGVEIHAQENGKMVVTLETGSDQEIVDRMTAISLLDGVLSTAMVFHHIENEAEMG